MQSNIELGERICWLTDLYWEQFEKEHVNTEESWRKLMEEAFEKALINWKIDCYISDQPLHFILEKYR
jgi:hypothetical protein